MEWLIALGGVMQIFGQMKQNMAEANQEIQNADYYYQQARYARYAAKRQEEITSFEYAQKVSTQASKYAGGNVSLASGSASLTMGGTVGQMVKEIYAIREKGRMEERLATMRAEGAAGRASQLRDPGYNLLQAVTTGINTYTGFRATQDKSSSADYGNFGEGKTG